MEDEKEVMVIWNEISGFKRKGAGSGGNRTHYSAAKQSELFCVEPCSKAVPSKRDKRSLLIPQPHEELFSKKLHRFSLISAGKSSFTA